MITIKSENGLHARPAGQVVSEAKKYDADIFLVRGDKRINAKSIISIMGMEIKQGEQIDIVCEGVDAEVAKRAIEEILNGV